jgi:hypothetical protein
VEPLWLGIENRTEHLFEWLRHAEGKGRSVKLCRHLRIMSHDRLPDISGLNSACQRLIYSQTPQFRMDDVSGVSIGIAEVIKEP